MRYVEDIARSESIAWHRDQWIMGLMTDAEFSRWIRANVLDELEERAKQLTGGK